MFSHFFGRFLIQNEIITSHQFQEIISYQKRARIKLGLIAVAEKLLTEPQVNELNKLEATMDKHFGDIAVEKGYLTKDQVDHLSNLQTNPYISFVQAVTELGFMTFESVSQQLLRFQETYQITNQDLEEMKQNNISVLTSYFIKEKEPLFLHHVSLLLKSIIRFINTDVCFSDVYCVSSYQFQYFASQYLAGEHQILVGFSADDALLEIANPYAKEEFTSVDDDAFDAVCEFINCVNGLYATELAENNIDVDMLPPLYYKSKSLVTSGKLFVLPLFINGRQIDLIIAIDSAINFQ